MADSGGHFRQTQHYKGTWLNANVTSTSGSPFRGSDGAELPRFDTIQVGSKRVVLTGVMSDNPKILRPGVKVEVSQPNKAMLKVFKEAAATGPVDLFVPLTHQGMDEDRATAKKLAKLIGSQGKMPVILGGHEHEVFHERAAPRPRSSRSGRTR